ncbi:hypothetical protein FACS189459_5360 [Bacilli bacterium]|nr:hypothetical protein FACS189459_5360 [Bacilli bacterium]GHU51772.1 hypothetical protein FACS189496_0760 [Bacilli bacterium]
MYAKIIPIIFCAIIGFIIVAIYGSQNTFLPNPDKKIDTPMADQMFPILGIFSIIPSLFYSFDGFYSSASIQRNMKEPKKFPFAIIAGLLIIAIIDLVITASLCVGSSDGSVVGLEETFNK